MTSWKSGGLKGDTYGYAAEIRSPLIGYHPGCRWEKKGAGAELRRCRGGIYFKLLWRESSLMDLRRPFVLSPLKRPARGQWGTKDSMNTARAPPSIAIARCNNKRLPCIFRSFAQFPTARYRDDKQKEGTLGVVVTSDVPSSFWTPPVPVTSTSIPVFSRPFSLFYPCFLTDRLIMCSGVSRSRQLDDTYCHGEENLGHRRGMKTRQSWRGDSCAWLALFLAQLADLLRILFQGIYESVLFALYHCRLAN